MTTRVEPLEPRLLLALVAIGDEMAVPMIRTAAILSDVAVADDGTYIVGASGDNRIAVNRYSAEGRLLPGQVELFGTEFALDIDPDGDAVVVWFGSLNSKTGGLFFRTISRTGVVSEPTTIFRYSADGSGANVWQPDVSMDDAGNFFIGYLFADSDAPQTVVRTGAYDARGGLRAPEFNANTIAQGPHVWDFHIAAYADGSGAALVYDVDVFETQDKHGEVVRVSTSARVGEVQKLPTQSRDPSIAMTGDRSFVVGYTLWKDYRDFTRDFVKGYVQRFDDSGAPVGTPAVLGASLPEAGLGVTQVAVDGDAAGGFVAAFLNSGPVQTMYASRHTAGAHDGTLALSTGFTEYPAVHTGPNGRVVATYHRGRIVYQHRLGAAAEPAPTTPYVLTVVGNITSEVFRVERNGGQIRVFRGGEIIETHDAALVVALHVSGMGDSDVIINETDLPSTLLGGEGFDHLTGGSNRDSIVGEFQDDVINGGGGNDILRGDDGDDSISGNAGNDTVHGGFGDDRLGGNGGRDRLFGNAGNDRIFGGAAGDWLYGQGGGDQLNGEGGLDRLYADDADQSTDHLHGNAGDDILIARDGFEDRLYGDGGRDSALFDEEDILESIEVTL